MISQEPLISLHNINISEEEIPFSRGSYLSLIAIFPGDFRNRVNYNYPLTSDSCAAVFYVLF